jgi:hypothetical protein
MEAGHRSEHPSDQHADQPVELTNQIRDPSLLNPGAERRSRSEGTHQSAVAADVHDVIRHVARRRGCAWLEIICLIGCFVLIGILILMHFHFVGDPPGENGCLPVKTIRELKPELIEIRIVGSFSRLAARLRSELSLAIQRRTDVVTIVLNSEDSKQSVNTREKNRPMFEESSLKPSEQAHTPKSRAGPLVALVKRTVAEPWKRVVASVRRVRGSMAPGQEESEAEQTAGTDMDDAIHQGTENSESSNHDSFFYLPLRMSSSFTASKVLQIRHLKT